MKTQQRSFVVEYKSRRRQSPDQQHSIWGGTNFKALIEEAQNDAPQLFQGKSASEAPAEIAGIAAQISVEQGVEASEILTTSERTVFADAAEESDSQIGQAAEVVAVPSLASAPETSAVEVSPPLLAKQVRRRAVPAVATATVRNTTDLLGEQANDLFLLEAENRRLKRLLAEHLLQQNIRLKKMMKRYDIG